MSGNFNLSAFFDTSCQITAKNADPELFDDYMAGVVIYFLPDDINIQDLSAALTGRLAQELPEMPRALWLSGPCKVYGMDGQEYRTSETQIVFEHLVETETVADLLNEAIEMELQKRGYPESDQKRVVLYPDNNADFEDTLLEIEKIKGRMPDTYRPDGP